MIGVYRIHDTRTDMPRMLRLRRCIPYGHIRKVYVLLAPIGTPESIGMRGRV